MKQYLFLLLGVLLSCGPSAEERSSVQKAREDSIIMAIENATKIKIERRLALTRELEDVKLMKEGYDNRLRIFKIEIQVQKDKLTSIKQYQFLRTPAEREQQVRKQVAVIEQQEYEIQELQDKIRKINYRLQQMEQQLKNYN